jgi:hypothetical protein
MAKHMRLKNKLLRRGGEHVYGRVSALAELHLGVKVNQSKVYGIC